MPRGGAAGALPHDRQAAELHVAQRSLLSRESVPFPVGLDPFTCTRSEIAEFGAGALALGISYLGLCCGAGPHHIRALAESIGRKPEASRYSADMSKHAFFGTHRRIQKIQREYRTRL